jgi:hypothetical protein
LKVLEIQRSGLKIELKVSSPTLYVHILVNLLQAVQKHCLLLFFPDCPRTYNTRGIQEEMILECSFSFHAKQTFFCLGWVFGSNGSIHKTNANMLDHLAFGILNIIQKSHSILFWNKANIG